MTDNNDVDVIIVGAGFAGMIAARELSRSGATVIVLDGRDRLGGRTWTKDSIIGLPIEMGGTWVHWTQPHVWSEVVRYDIPLVATPLAEESYWFADGAAHRGEPDELEAMLDPGMTALLAPSVAAFPHPHEVFPLSDNARSADEQTIAEAIAALDISEADREMVHGLWSLHFHAHPTRGAYSQALRWGALVDGDWRRLSEACERFKFVNGTRQLLEAIAADVTADIRLATPVRSIVEAEDGVTVTTADGTELTAGRVIVTAPINALPNIDIQPPAPPEVESLAEGQASAGIKLWIRVRGAVRPFHALGSGEHPLNWIQYEFEVDGDTILVAFGPDARKLDYENVEAVAAAVHTFRPDLEVIGVDVHDWTVDEFARQTWPMLRPGQLAAIEHLQSRDDGRRTVFAGSDYARGWAGFIDGAIESGARAARHIINAHARETESSS